MSEDDFNPLYSDVTEALCKIDEGVERLVDLLGGDLDTFELLADHLGLPRPPRPKGRPGRSVVDRNFDEKLLQIDKEQGRKAAIEFGMSRRKSKMAIVVHLSRLRKKDPASKLRRYLVNNK